MLSWKRNVNVCTHIYIYIYTHVFCIIVSSCMNVHVYIAGGNNTHNSSCREGARQEAERKVAGQAKLECSIDPLLCLVLLVALSVARTLVACTLGLRLWCSFAGLGLNGRRPVGPSQGLHSGIRDFTMTRSFQSPVDEEYT